MERCFLFGNYNTWNDWGLLLTGKTDLEPPTVKTNYVAIEGMNGSLDLSEALTGEPTYEDRSFSASFCACDSSYEERRALLDNIINAIHGRKMKIVEPDNPNHYLYGRVGLKNVNHRVSHSEFTVEMRCDPWRYGREETLQTMPVDSDTPTDVLVYNGGRKTVCPDIHVSGQVTFTCCGVTSSATSGTYKITTFKLYQGENIIQVSGSGTLTLIYREAVL